MSYDISLYKKSFLKKALEENLGDWTSADPVDEKVIKSIIEKLSSLGFIEEEGVAIGREFTMDNDMILAQAISFNNSVSFMIPYSPKAEKSIEFCSMIAREIATEYSLGFHDPQTGEDNVF